MDDNLFKEILDSFNETIKEFNTERKENEDDSGFLYDLHEKMREIVSTYNDTMKGRCAVCLESFCPEGEEQE